MELALQQQRYSSLILGLDHGVSGSVKLLVSLCRGRRMSGVVQTRAYIPEHSYIPSRKEDRR